MTILIVVIAIAVIATVALRLAVPRLSSNTVASGKETVNGATVLGDCPNTPNCQGSESTRSSQKVDRFDVSKPESNAIASIANIVNAMPGTEIVMQDDRYLHATYTTGLMGYIDDVEFLLSDDNQSVQVRSASRLGKSDLGANAKRVALLRTLLTGEI